MYDVIIRNGDLIQTIHESGVVYGNNLASAKIEDAKNAISSFDFTIYPNNDGYDLLSVYRTKVFVYNIDRGRYDFIGRVIQIEPCMDKDGSVYKNVVCESRLGYLCDTVQPYEAPKQYSGDGTKNGLQEFIDLLLSNHNSQVDADHRIYRGNVSVVTHESSEGVYKGLNYETTWDCIIKKLVDVYGGEIRLRETDGVLYLDYAEEIGETRATTIELGKNMESVQRSIDCTGVVTRLIPLGMKLPEQVMDEQGNVTERETENRLTIASVNDGVIYIEDETAVSLYGKIYQTVVFDDVTDPQNLLTKGMAHLAKHNVITESNKIVSLDLSMLGLDVDDFQVYDRYPVRNELVGLFATLEIIKKTTDVVDPYSSTFDLGDNSVTMNDSIIDLDAAYTEIRGEIRETVDKASNNQMSSVYTIVTQTVDSAMRVSEERITASVSETTVSKNDYETFSQTVRNILQMDEEGTTMLFQTINEAIADVNNASASRYAEILKYIRFEDGNIILGESGNPITLKIENDQIAFYYGGVPVSEWNEDKFSAANGEFTKTFRVGKFSAEPRENGNTTWRVG